MSATRETTARRVRERIWAISSKVRPSSRRRRVSLAGEDTFDLPSLLARSPPRKRRRASRISLPYISTRLSPKPETRRSSSKLVGFTTHRSTRAESWRTTKAATPFSLAVLRRHSRMYSFNSKSAEVDSVGTVGRGVAGRARDEYVVCGLRAASRFLRGDCTAISSQSGVAAQASQLPQRSHLGVSPKWRQTWRWRHSLDCTKRSTSW